MKKRYFVAVEGLTPEQEKSLLGYFKEQGVAWWHHIANVWLIVDRKDNVSAQGIRDKIKEIATMGGPCLIMQVHDDITWSGLYRSGRKDTFDWIKKTWTGE